MGVLSNLKFYFKSAVFGTLISGCALYGVIASLVLRIVGKEQYAQYTVAKVFYYVFSKVLRVKITINNEEYLKIKSGIVISNHQSALDILILGKIFQPGYTVTAKKALQYLPILGWFMLASGTFFLDRSKGEKARKVLGKALEGVKENNRSLFIFPEGTRSGSTKLDLLPFKKGAFHLAAQGQIPIVPVVVSNTSTIFNSKEKVFNTGEIIIDVLKPMPTKDLRTNDQISEFATQVREKMLNSLQSIGYSKIGCQQPELEISDSVGTEDVDEISGVETLSEQTPLVAKN